MKKIFVVLCVVLMAVTAFAGGAVTLVPDATVHNGVAAGDAAGFIDGEGALDVSGMPAGALISFDVVLADFDFNLAGYQFQVNYPAYMSLLSTDAADWVNGTNAVMTAGALVDGVFPLQPLPADNTGAETAPSISENFSGIRTVGLLFTDPTNRALGSVETPNAGGSILHMSFSLGTMQGATERLDCTSFKETISIALTATFSGPTDDIFANENAERVTIASDVVFATISHPSSELRANGFDRAGNSRNSRDALPSLRCSLAGETTRCAGWTNEDGVTVEMFRQAFDYNCSGAVSSRDALSNLRLALGRVNRTPVSKNTVFYAADSSNALAVDYNGQKGAMASMNILSRGLRFSEPQISDEAKSQGWILVHQRTGDALEYILVNPADENSAYPDVRISYERIATVANFAISETDHQYSNLEPFAYSPALRNGSGQPINDRPAVDRIREK